MGTASKYKIKKLMQMQNVVTSSDHGSENVMASTSSQQYTTFSEALKEVNYSKKKPNNALLQRRDSSEWVHNQNGGTVPIIRSERTMTSDNNIKDIELTLPTNPNEINNNK